MCLSYRGATTLDKYIHTMYVLIHVSPVMLVMRGSHIESRCQSMYLGLTPCLLIIKGCIWLLVLQGLWLYVLACIGQSKRPQRLLWTASKPVRLPLWENSLGSDPTAAQILTELKSGERATSVSQPIYQRQPKDIQQIKTPLVRGASLRQLHPSYFQNTLGDHRGLRKGGIRL